VFKKSFRGEIFFYFILVFFLFTGAILTFQYQREKKYRTLQLENTLDNISEITYRFVEQNNLAENNNIDRVNELKSILPQPHTRITLIDKTGNVLYDSFVPEYDEMENHLHRPEIEKAIADGKGSNIRHSETTNQEFYYYAKNYPEFFVRTAVVYDLQIKNFLKAESAFIVFIVSLFGIIGVLLYFVTGRLSVSITKLKNFSIKAGRNERIELDTSFPENELGIIGSQIIRIYNNLKKTKDELSNEKEKLFNHLNALNEGIAFFSPKKEKTLSNSHFIQYLNIISQKTIKSPERIFELTEFKKLNNFLKNHVENPRLFKSSELPQLEYVIRKGDKYYKVQSIVFLDLSFEVMISDITKLEKRRLMKQQLTSNIAHELKTPLASIKGYIETMLENRPVPEDKQEYFLTRAYSQADRLTALINDVSLLNNIEDAGELFPFKPVDIKKIVDEVYENFANRMHERTIKFESNIKKGTVIRGNDSLLFSVFQNFVENSINYGGTGITISIKMYHEDEKFYFFSYSDDGEGIPQKHLSRIFERFYRVDHGRSREKGGTGLGLAIVKNAIQLHKGDISVKNNPKKGVEFLFSLSKK
jgi:two-component system OmpR family sensor kinase/two-component system phosphate regulon sensor histidine kinase PhoR